MHALAVIECNYLSMASVAVGSDIFLNFSPSVKQQDQGWVTDKWRDEIPVLTGTK
jgi:hypothetical protein